MNEGMTMVFRVQEPAMLKQVKVGDKVRFDADRINGPGLAQARTMNRTVAPVDDNGFAHSAGGNHRHGGGAFKLSCPPPSRYPHGSCPSSGLHGPVAFALTGCDRRSAVPGTNRQDRPGDGKRPPGSLGRVAFETNCRVFRFHSSWYHNDHRRLWFPTLGTGT